MTTTRNPPKLKVETDFLDFVKTRTEDDTGAKAAMKRAMSGEQRHQFDIYPLVLPFLSKLKQSEDQQDLWMFVASMATFYPSECDRPWQNFGQSCRDLSIASASNGTERRFRALLDMAQSDVRSPLTALVRQMKSKTVLIHYPQLLHDLSRWEHPDRYVQDRWAKTYWSALPIDD